MNGDIEMTEREENLRDAMKDEAAFDHVPLRVVHDHMNADGTEQKPACGHLNCDPEGRGWKCLDCGAHLTNERMGEIVKRSKLLSSTQPDTSTNKEI